MSSRNKTHEAPVRDDHDGQIYRDDVGAPASQPSRRWGSVPVDGRLPDKIATSGAGGATG